jgi:chromosomal replication initiator protein
MELMEGILNRVSKMLEIPVLDILGRSRIPNIVEARQICMYLFWKSGVTFEKVGEAFDRDHSTVIHARDKVESTTPKTDKVFWYKLMICNAI